LEAEGSDESHISYRGFADRNRSRASASRFGHPGHHRQFRARRVRPLHGNAVKDGGFGNFHHNRTPTEIDRQFVIRMNRDTLYSAGVFDLDAGPVTITMHE
jgi:hypothetical protein